MRQGKRVRPLSQGITTLAWLAANAYSAASDCSPQNAACRPCRREDPRLVNGARSGAGVGRMSEPGAPLPTEATRVDDGPEKGQRNFAVGCGGSCLAGKRKGNFSANKTRSGGCSARAPKRSPPALSSDRHGRCAGCGLTRNNDALSTDEAECVLAPMGVQRRRKPTGGRMLGLVVGGDVSGAEDGIPHTTQKGPRSGCQMSFL